ncbi:MAG: type II secretion system GspH family protein, partial [Dehalococcoidia bacterium]|nr:type II secretion system GspH family protein [Dehalococcoidia bacterium]
MSGLLIRRESGMTMVETLTVVAMLGIIGTIALTGLASSVSGGGIVVERAAAIALVQRQLEYLKTLPYQPAPSEYGSIEVPQSYRLTCQSQPLPDGNMQKVVVTLVKNDRPLLVIESIKVN